MNPHPLAVDHGPPWEWLGWLIDSGEADRAAWVAYWFGRLGLDPSPILCGPSQWAMTQMDRGAITLIAHGLAPTVAVETGTFRGGSARGLAPHCGRVVTIDMDPEAGRFVADLPNVDFRVGPAAKQLGEVLDEYPDAGLVVLDADHSAEGIVAEVRAVLDRPATRCLVIHDSQMPDCREGLDSIDWANEPGVVGMQLDFLPGTVNDGRQVGGLAVGWLSPG